jgi:hypothetical protein
MNGSRDRCVVKRSPFFPGLFFAIVFFFFVSATGERGASDEMAALHLIYSNDIAGYLEPCG